MPVRINRHDALMHLKQVVIDDHINTSGSANHTTSGNRYNDERLDVITDARLTAKARENFWPCGTTMNDSWSGQSKRWRMGQRVIETDVAIVGAGGGGAVLALMLAQQGCAPGVGTGCRAAAEVCAGKFSSRTASGCWIAWDCSTSYRRMPFDPVHRFNFCRSGGERLCTVDYSDLPLPYNRAVVTLPNVAHHAILDALEQQNPGGLWYDAVFTGLRFDGSRVVGLQATVTMSQSRCPRVWWSARRRVSKVRESLGIAAELHRYPEVISLPF